MRIFLRFLFLDKTDWQNAIFIFDNLLIINTGENEKIFFLKKKKIFLINSFQISSIFFILKTKIGFCKIFLL